MMEVTNTCLYLYPQVMRLIEQGWTKLCRTFDFFASRIDLELAGSSFDAFLLHNNQLWASPVTQ